MSDLVIHRIGEEYVSHHIGQCPKYGKVEPFQNVADYVHSGVGIRRGGERMVGSQEAETCCRNQ
jgi:hypothetical protein